MKVLKNEARESKSISVWKSGAFKKLLEVDIKARVIEQGYCIDISSLTSIFIQYLSDDSEIAYTADNRLLKQSIIASDVGSQISFLRPRRSNLCEIIICKAGRTNVEDSYHSLEEICTNSSQKRRPM